MGNRKGGGEGASWAGRPRERGQSQQQDKNGPQGARSCRSSLAAEGLRLSSEGNGELLEVLSKCLQDWHVTETAQQAESQTDRAGGEKVVEHDRDRRESGVSEGRERSPSMRQEATGRF